MLLAPTLITRRPFQGLAVAVARFSGRAALCLQCAASTGQVLVAGRGNQLLASGPPARIRALQQQGQ
ncbi:MAG TPA: hypothetical protein DEA94_02150 [Rhodobacteraceae bacterium]|nr:hypothetical protein [Paracoccaceae bacterium]